MSVPPWINIAFDLDGTLVNIMEPFIHFAYDRFGVKVQPPKQYDLTVDIGLSRYQVDQIIDMVFEHWWLIPFYRNANIILQYLYKHTERPVTIITARNSDYEGVTRCLLDKFDVEYDLIFAESSGDKFQKLGDISAYVEDRRKTAICLAGRGKTIFLPDRPWNQDFWRPGIYRFDDFYEFEQKYFSYYINEETKTTSCPK